MIFLLGVINYQKEYGTDYPGQIIILIIFLIFFYKSDNLLNKNDHKIFYVMLLLAYFAVSIKLFNVLIFILLLFIFLRLNNKIKIIFFYSLLSLPLFFWILQNYLINDYEVLNSAIASYSPSIYFKKIEGSEIIFYIPSDAC